MKLVFSGLDKPMELEAGECSTLEVQSPALFARFARSLLSGEGRYADEPYSVWDGDAELKPKDSLLVIDNPLQLPWDERGLTGTIVKHMEREYLEDEDLRRAIEDYQRSINSALMALGLGMNADWTFSQEWDFKRYLKFAGFGVYYQDGKSFLDNLLNFLSLALDAGEKRAFVLVNLKTFCQKMTLEPFSTRCFSKKRRFCSWRTSKTGSIMSMREKEWLTCTLLRAKETYQSSLNVLCSGDFAPIVLAQCQSDW